MCGPDLNMNTNAQHSSREACEWYSETLTLQITRYIARSAIRVFWFPQINVSESPQITRLTLVPGGFHSLASDPDSVMLFLDKTLRGPFADFFSLYCPFLFQLISLLVNNYY
uniref:Uncharacterized protein n=1 Tax=Cacopsylla melanoneura TaxID=428564 RepID=A0A8D9F976_9HEMI